MKKKLICLYCILWIWLLVFSGCQARQYNENDFIGSTSGDIIAEYGDFDRIPQNAQDSDGLYRDCCCGYLVEKADYSFLGNRFDKYFMIYFDEAGLAYRCAYEEVA